MNAQERTLALLDEAIALDRAAKGNIQLVEPQTGHLQIVAQRGFNKDFLRHFAVVKRFDSTACGRALGSRIVVTIPDMLREPGWELHRAVCEANEVRSCKSVPLFAPDSSLVGVLSTHSPDVRWDWDRESTRGIAEQLGRLLSQQPA